MTAKTISNLHQISLIGRCFHSIKPETGKVHWQGMVIGNPLPGWYLLQLYEYLIGEPNIMKLVKIEDMAGWIFYLDCEEMKFSYEHGAAREGGPYRDRIKE